MITETIKQYVGAIVAFQTDGTMLPRYVRWTDDELYKKLSFDLYADIFYD